MEYLQFFKEHKDYAEDLAEHLLCYSIIDGTIRDPEDDVYDLIAERSIEVYGIGVKAEYNLTDIAYRMCCAYIDGDIDVDKLLKMHVYEIANAIGV